jgi:hypothetical protein
MIPAEREHQNILNHARSAAKLSAKILVQQRVIAIFAPLRAVALVFILLRRIAIRFDRATDVLTVLC